MTAGIASDRRKDAAYFDTKIRHISDEELFAAMEGFSDLQDWAAHWQAARQRVLFYDAEEFLSDRQEAARSFSPRRSAILDNASRVLAHDIVGWGDVRIAHGSVVDFNADYGRAGQYGFNFWDWSRPLVQAFFLTDDPKYLAGFDRLFNQWYEQRDRVKGHIEPLDVIWYELGLGRRSRIFLEFYALAEDLSLQTHERMLKALLGASRWLCEEQKSGNRLGNWQIMGSYGLGLIGLMVPEFRESEQWISLAVDRLAWHLEKDFYPDGCHWERCPSDYMLVAYRDIHNLATMLARSDRHAPQAERLSQPLKRSLGFFHAILPPDGVIPAINDGRRTALPARMAAEMHALHPEPAPSAQLPSGFTVLRAFQHQMLINHGPSAGGHTHLDALTFELHAFGRPMAIDSGIGLTYDDPNHAAWYRRARAHNMLTIGNADPDRKVTAARETVLVASERFDYFAASHHGYEASQGVVHRRHFLFAKPHYFLVYDVIVGASPEQKLEWNLHSPLSFEQKDGGFVAGESPGLLVVPSSERWTASQATGLAAVGGVPGFSEWIAPIRWLKFAGLGERDQPAHFAVLLYPFEGNPPEVRFAAELGEEQACFTISRAQATDQIRIDQSSGTAPDIHISTES